MVAAIRRSSGLPMPRCTQTGIIVSFSPFFDQKSRPEARYEATIDRAGFCVVGVFVMQEHVVSW